MAQVTLAWSRSVRELKVRRTEAQVGGTARVDIDRVLDGGDSLARGQESDDLAGQGDAIDGVGDGCVST